jgi:hypothetical protein
MIERKWFAALREQSMQILAKSCFETVCTMLRIAAETAAVSGNYQELFIYAIPFRIFSGQ